MCNPVAREMSTMPNRHSLKNQRKILHAAYSIGVFLMFPHYPKEEMIEVTHVHPKLKTDASDTKKRRGK